MKNIVKILVVLQILWSSNVWAEELKAYANRTEVPQGETFILTLETDDDKTSASPDLSVLEKDFTVYSVGNAFQSSYVNGKTSHSRQWQIVLMPKNSGKIEIPAIKVGSQKSEPIILNVAPAQLAKQAKAGNDAVDQANFAVDAEVDDKNPFVQQQINYTFRIYDTGGLNGDAPMIVDDGQNNWIIKSLGEPSISSKVINGRQFREIEFKYALFPQKSGLLKTPEIEFNGYYLTRSRRSNSPFDDVFNSGFFKMGFSDMFATRNPVVLRPEPIEIDVKAIPAANGGYWWLPASQVMLSAEWETKNPVFRVGEAISRMVYLKAAGVTESQLPDLKFAEITGIKQYPDKPIAMSTENHGKVVSAKKFNTVFIPEREGEFIIPEVSIDWYNTHSGKIEKATLPAQKIKVLSATGVSIPLAETPQMSEPVVDNTPIESAQQKNIPVTQQQKEDVPVWLWPAGAFVLGLLLSYLLFGRRSVKASTHSIGFYAKEIEKNARQGDLKALRDNLLVWAKLTYPQKEINNLDDVIVLIREEELKLQLQQLGQALYSSKEPEFEANVFVRAFQNELKKQKKNKKVVEPLPKLYK